MMVLILMLVIRIISPNNKPADNDNQMINVSISIDCKTILNNMNDLKDGYEQFIPKN